MNDNDYIAIMAGGVGSRFWPASRENRPKQFLDILGAGRSLLQQTVDRAACIVPIQNILIVSNAIYKNTILEQLPEMGADQLLLEPSRNNTAPCIAYTALHLLAKNGEAVFAVLPSDHVILKQDEFVRHMRTAFNHARAHSDIVTLGIQPTRPDTGYGYINYKDEEEASIYTVNAFVEKPSLEVAESYIAQGGYLWNAGIFVWSVDTILAGFRENASDILDVLINRDEHYNTPKEQQYINEVYPHTRSVSVDFAILEHADNVVTIPADIGWSDLGTWNSLYAYLPKDEGGNVIQVHEVHKEEVKNCLITSSANDKLIVIKGLEDYVVIDDDDVLLIYPRNAEQEIKTIRNGYKGSRFV